MTTGALPALPTISGLVAQPAERPVVCGRVEGATPSGSANFKSYREADFQGFGVAFLRSDVSKNNRPEFQCVV